MHFFTQSPLLKALGWALFDSLWQMALLWLLYSLLVFIFRPMTAGMRHGLALMLVSLGAFWSGTTFIAAWCWPQQDHWTTGLWLNLLPVTQQGMLWQISRFFTDVILVDGSSVYLLVLGGLLIRYLCHYRQSRQLTRHGLSKLPSELRVFVSATSNQMGIRPPVSAWLSSRVDVPLTLGHLKPYILLPVAMLNHLTTQQVEAILVHELAHIRRHDYLLHQAVTALEGIFFFNPFTRLLIRQVKKERENCCDDLVLQFRYDRHSYVSALLSLATRSQKVQRALAATGDGDRLLLQRAKRILQQKQSHDRTGARPLALLLLTGMITLITVYGPVHPGVRQQAAIAITTQPAAIAITTRIRMSGYALPALHQVHRAILSVRTTTVGMSSAAPRSPGSHSSGAKSRMSTLRRQQAAIDAIGSDADDVEPEGNNISFVKTADDADQTYQSDQPYQPDQSDGPDPADVTPREYSIRLIRPDATPGRIIQLNGTPFVPNASFSYLFTAADSAHAAEQLLYLQESTRRDILSAMTKLQQEFDEQMKALIAREVRAAESLPLRRQLRSRELQLQQLYLRKIIEWEKRLENAGHLRKIVDI